MTQDPHTPIPGHMLGTRSPWFRYARLHSFQSTYTISCASIQANPFPDLPFRFIAAGIQSSHSTARINILLQLFPDAKFIHIHRNPYHQYLSMVRFMQKVIPLYCVQIPPSFEEVDDHLIRMYERMYKKYLKDCKLIPKGNLVEIRYEDFISDPLKDLERIYKNLDLDSYDLVKKRFQAYLLSQSEFHPMEYNISDEVREKISKHWGFAFDAFGYDK